ncbi:DUF2946 domain-containing protein [Pseudescherichia vulneris]|uniref:DUF2946 domain-containing protein n=1 Tax=Pseudescherichia vulneris TaxID=566 RepID=UPI0028AEDF76|nr:DUF2946 domain-containing protein [Pseudescherichia vulneris]
MHATWLRQLRFLKRHLLMLLIAFGWLLFQSQVAIASHDCTLDMQGESAMLQHVDHMQVREIATTHALQTPLCDKHCVPDAMQKESGHGSLVALPVETALAVSLPVCVDTPPTEWSLTPPAAGPPATIRFCRFRE